MTSRTHDLGGVTALILTMVYVGVPTMSLATMTVALGANLIGAIFPDLDQPTAGMWMSMPAGSIVGRLVHPLLGGHRFISHSLLGWALCGFLLHWFLNLISGVLIVNMEIVWWAFMLGYASHLVLDTITKEGVPWLFPIPFRFGIPPLKFFRITTGGMVEKGIVFPGLLILNGYLIYQHYNFFLSFFRHFVH